MRIGVVSDTHNNLANVRRIVELFNAANVERVIHTGDITQAKTLDLFAHLRAPLYGVFGNNDVERDALDAAVARHRFTFAEPPFRLAWHERSIVVVHDPRELERVHVPDFALALHGHTHHYRHEIERGAVVFNPGESAGHMEGHNAIGVVDLATLSVDLLRF